MKKSTRLYPVLLLGMLLALVLAACGGGGAATTPAAGTGATQPAATEAPETATEAAETATEAPEATEAATSGATAEATAGAAIDGARGEVTIGSKNFTEAILVAEIYAQLLEDAGFTVERKMALGATPIAHEALVKGDIDLYPEYTSTGLQEVLNITDRLTTSEEILERVRSEYKSQFQLTWLDASAFSNTNSFAMTQETASQLGIATYSDMVAKASELTLAGPPEFPDRQDTKGLEETYGEFIANLQGYAPVEIGLQYDALQNGLANIIVVFTTDGRIVADELVLLEDDQNYYPIYNIAPAIRQDTLEQYPDIEPILNAVAPLMTEDAMAGMNYQVDGPEKMEPADVAKAFLEEQGLLGQ
jgi:osmoprotectant transport system substrate-binding protein